MSLVGEKVTTPLTFSNETVPFVLLSPEDISSSPIK
nr:MAG TPA: hypothetical protein [Caudoviricetes sp.]